MSVPWLGTRWAGVVTAIQPSPRSGKSTTTGFSSVCSIDAMLAAGAGAGLTRPARGDQRALAGQGEVDYGGFLWCVLHRRDASGGCAAVASDHGGRRAGAAACCPGI